MHLVVTAVVWGVLGAPAAASSPTDDAIGIVWHQQATVAPAIQQRLARQLTRPGQPGPVVDAVAVARAHVALELDAARAEAIVRWSDALDAATADYRAGEIEAARGRLDELSEAIRADPVVPGAARVLWRVHVLQGQLAWSAGDLDGQDAALAAAVALDPEARPSTREVPPAVVEAYTRQRAAVVAAEGRWPSLTIELETPGMFGVEIDGVPGWRAVPPGEHLVVVRRAGVAPVGAVVGTDRSWRVPDGEVVIDDGLPIGAEQAERICDRVAVAELVLARMREQRLGLQRYVCGEGFAPAWYSGYEGWGPGVQHVLEGPGALDGVSAVLHLEQAWPAILPRPHKGPVVGVDGGAPMSVRARVRRAVPWILIGGVIAGSVTLGVLLGTDAAPDLAIDGNGFLGR